MPKYGRRKYDPPLKNTEPGANYEMMFGGASGRLVPPSEFFPNGLPIIMRDEMIEPVMRTARTQKKWVLLYVIGTKPCFYKFYGAIAASRSEGTPHLILDSGQHYDPLLTYGSHEFGYKSQTAINLQIRGNLAQKTSELFLKTSYLARYFKENWPDVTVVPVVLGDTILTSIIPASWLFTRGEKSIQNEAGLRSMAPSIMKELAQNKNLSLEKFVEGQFKGPWDRLNNEPFPEQFDTFTSAAGCQYHFSPIELNRRNLIEEGHDPANIFVTGGVVVDALDLKKREKPEQSIFKVYPALARGRWLRIDIHRRENLTRRRFTAIIQGIAKLVRRGVAVNFVEMNATKFALDQYHLRSMLTPLMRRPNFLWTPIWPEYAQVVEFYDSDHCLGALTDSGGLQEELNMLGKLCLTCRFNTDRPETVRQSQGNLLVPPISGDFVYKMVDYVLSNDRLKNKMEKAKPLYGRSAGAKFISSVETLMSRGAKTFNWAHERLGFWQEPKSHEGLL